MNQKKAKRMRRNLRRYYKIALEVWMEMKPPWWRFIARRRWKKRKPELIRAGRTMRRVRRNGT